MPSTSNRAPLPNEVQACTPFLQRQIKVIGPKVICALGTSAAHHLLHTDVPVSVLRGRFHPLGGLQVMVTYHPGIPAQESKCQKAGLGRHAKDHGCYMNKTRPSIREISDRILSAALILSAITAVLALPVSPKRCATRLRRGYD